MKHIVHYMTCPCCDGWGWATHWLDLVRWSCWRCNGHGWISHRTTSTRLVLPEEQKDISWLWEDCE